MPNSEYHPTTVDREDVVKRFTYQKPHGTQPERSEYIRSRTLDLAAELIEMVPDSRERSLALTRLEEYLFWANAAMARNEKEKTDAGS